MKGWVLGLLITAAILGILQWLRYGVRAEYAGGVLRVWLCISRLRIRVVDTSRKKKKDPEKEKKKAAKKAKKKEKKKQEAEKAKSEPKKPKKKHSLGEILELVKSIGGVAGRLMRRIRVDELRGEITVGGDDAAKTAQMYGYLWSGVGTLHAFLDNILTLKRFDVQVYADFSGEKTRAEGVLEMSFRSLYITAAVCGFIRALIKNRSFFLGAGKSAHKKEKTLAKSAAADLAGGENTAE